MARSERERHTHIRIKKTNRKKRYGQMSKFKWKFDKHQSLKLKLAEILVGGVKNQKDVGKCFGLGAI